MKKKILALLLCVTMSIGITACGGKEEPKEITDQGTKEPDNNEEQKNTKELKKAQEPEAKQKEKEKQEEKKTEDVVITIPASFYESLGIEVSEETLEQEEEEGAEYTLNEDGSVTCKMTRAAYERKMEEFKTEMQKTIDEIVADKETYPSIIEITVNDDYSEFLVKTTAVSKDDFSMSESMMDMIFSVSAGAFQMFMEDAPEKIEIIYVNVDSGAVVYSFDSSSAE